MFKERLSKISTKILYVLFAVVISVTIWVYVEITINEMQIFDVPGIEFEFLNEEIFRDRGFSITSRTPETLTVTFEASRSEMIRLTAQGALTAEVDLSSIMSTGTTTLPYRLVYPPDVNTNAVSEIGASAARIIITVDTVREREIRIRPYYDGGTASDELFVEDIEVNPQYIVVRGPDRVVSMIQYARVTVYRENLTTTYSENLEFVLIDDNGDELDSDLVDLLELIPDTVQVTVSIREIKEIPLIVNFRYGSSTSEENTHWAVEPQSIMVSGDPVAIENYANSILLATIDTTTFSFFFENTYRIIIPEHLTNESGIYEARVTIDIIGLDIAFFVVSEDSMHPSNIPPGYRVEIITPSLDVRLRGLSESLEQITPENIRVVTDLSDRSGAGTFRERATVSIIGIETDVDPIGEYFLTVRIVPEEN
jgi:YbbR domain-containing protein